MSNFDESKNSLIRAYCMILQCLGRARADLYEIQLGVKPTISTRHLLPASIQKYVAFEFSKLTQPPIPFTEECLSESDRVHSADDFHPVVNTTTLAVLYFAFDSIRQAWPQISNDTPDTQLLTKLIERTSLFSIAKRYGCNELDFAINGQQFIGDLDWKWYSENH